MYQLPGQIALFALWRSVIGSGLLAENLQNSASASLDEKSHATVEGGVLACRG
jgi:hypothetical protein